MIGSYFHENNLLCVGMYQMYSATRGKSYHFLFLFWTAAITQLVEHPNNDPKLEGLNLADSGFW
jgi:hypothetical protein